MGSVNMIILEVEIFFIRNSGPITETIMNKYINTFNVCNLVTCEKLWKVRKGKKLTLTYNSYHYHSQLT